MHASMLELICIVHVHVALEILIETSNFCWRYNHKKNNLNILIHEKLDQAVNELEYTILLQE